MQKVKYTLSCYAKITPGGPSTDTFWLTMRVANANGDVKWKMAPGNINDNDWTFVKGTVDLGEIEGDISDVRIYAAGASPATSFLVDDMSVEMVKVVRLNYILTRL